MSQIKQSSIDLRSQRWLGSSSSPAKQTQHCLKNKTWNSKIKTFHTKKPMYYGPTYPRLSHRPGKGRKRFWQRQNFLVIPWGMPWQNPSLEHSNLCLEPELDHSVSAALQGAIRELSLQWDFESPWWKFWRGKHLQVHDMNSEKATVDIPFCGTKQRKQWTLCCRPWSFFAQEN